MSELKFRTNPLNSLACESIRFSTLFAAGDVSRRGETDVFAGYEQPSCGDITLGFGRRQVQFNFDLILDASAVVSQLICYCD